MRLYLLRHGEVASHRGDVPITPDAEHHAYAMGKAIGADHEGPVSVLCGETRRASETAAHLARGLVDAGREVIGPTVAFALRNPDLYLGGVRVNMVSSPEALAEQVPGLDTGNVGSLDFFPEFIESSDRIGWWLAHPSPPGDDASSVVARVRSFAASLDDPVSNRAETTVAVTHSPLLRSLARDSMGHDMGEPPWVSGLLIEINRDDALVIEPFQWPRP